MRRDAQIMRRRRECKPTPKCRNQHKRREIKADDAAMLVTAAYVMYTWGITQAVTPQEHG